MCRWWAFLRLAHGWMQALLRCTSQAHSPKAATFHASADVRLLALGRDDFTSLLGPLQELLESQAVAYDTPTSKISKVGYWLCGLDRRDVGSHVSCGRNKHTRWHLCSSICLCSSRKHERQVTPRGALLCGCPPRAPHSCCRVVAHHNSLTLVHLQALKLEDLKHVACLGAGAFGKVTLVQVRARWLQICCTAAHVPLAATAVRTKPCPAAPLGTLLPA